jgi:hypothetical protein
MNIAFFTFWILIFILLGFFIFLSVENIKQIQTLKNDPYEINNSALQFCYPGGNIENLYPVTTTKPCTIGGVETLTYKFNNPAFLNNSPVLVNLAPTDYLTACSGFCVNYDPLQNVCNDTNRSNPKYFDCTAKLKPTGNCIQSALPIAYIGQDAYYLYQTNQAGCLGV